MVGRKTVQAEEIALRLKIDFRRAFIRSSKHACTNKDSWEDLELKRQDMIKGKGKRLPETENSPRELLQE